MEIYTIADIREIQKTQKYKHIGLDTLDGKAVIKKNSNHMKPEKRLEEIERRLKAPTLPDGYYVVHGRMHHTAEADRYTIKKGNPEEAPTAPVVATKVVEHVKPDQVLTYENALALNTKIAELEAQVLAVKKERDEAYDLVSDLEEEAENGLSEPTGKGDLATMISEVSKNLMPLADRYFDNEEKRLQIEEGKIVRDLQFAQNGHGVPPTQQTPHQQPDPGFQELSEEALDELPDDEYNRYRMALLVHLAKTDPERYNQIMDEMNKEGEPDE